MATIGNSYVNLIDVYKQEDKNGDSVAVIEMLMEMNPILDDAMAIECNSGAKHLHTVRAGLPEVTWGMLKIIGFSSRRYHRFCGRFGSH